MDLRTEHLAEVLQHAVAPSFVLGAVVAFLALLTTRIETLMHRMRLLVAPCAGDEAPYPERDVALLRRRVALLHRAVFVTVCSGITGALLVIVAFVFGLLSLSHEIGMGLLFLLTLGLMAVALALFAREAWIAMRQYDRFG